MFSDDEDGEKAIRPSTHLPTGFKSDFDISREHLRLDSIINSEDESNSLIVDLNTHSGRKTQRVTFAIKTEEPKVCQVTQGELTYKAELLPGSKLENSTTNMSIHRRSMISSAVDSDSKSSFIY
jgi:hypothetical protein